jgi:hypothetical protein
VSTYSPIASVTLSSAQSSVTFSGIPQTYTDLVLVCTFTSSSTVATPSIRVGNTTIDTGSNYSTTILSGTSNAASYRESNKTYGVISGLVSGVANITSNVIVNIQNYSNTTTNKTLLARGNGTSEVEANVILWRSTSAINTVQIIDYSGGSNTFASGSTFNIYGVNAQASAQAKAYGGDTIITDGTYWYHVFRSSGTFTPTSNLTADCLVVAGGGGTGQSGGGAGGLLAHTSQALTTTAYTVTVGAGGAAGATNGNQGSNSQFGSLTASVGGGYGADGVAGGNGGSGGGGGGTSSAGGTPTSGQGNAGGSGGGNGYPNESRGGGGGAGAVGSNGSAGGVGGAGGVGSSTYSSWGSATNTGQLVSGTYYYAGGGGGWGRNGNGVGGSGGGANASSGNNASGLNGTANTGGGAGGVDGSPRGTGGSGIVIVRYAAV